MLGGRAYLMLLALGYMLSFRYHEKNQWLRAFILVSHASQHIRVSILSVPNTSVDGDDKSKYLHELPYRHHSQDPELPAGNDQDSDSLQPSGLRFMGRRLYKGSQHNDDYPNNNVSCFISHINYSRWCRQTHDTNIHVTYLIVVHVTAQDVRGDSPLLTASGVHHRIKP